ncbi:MAG: PHP domain-containing protein [Legionella sp.]|nr:PHP domain-containing protein [Legionella sp.]
MIDLHCHSHFSDGVLSPQDLFAIAQKQKLTCLSLTDHDTLAGFQQLKQAAANTSIKIIPGVELSTRWKKHDIHILGYQFRVSPAFEALIAGQNLSRIQRAKDIGALLNRVGVTDAYAKACELAGHERIGRPHFAKILVKEGKVREMQAAFSQFLGRGKIAYVPTSWISVQEAVEGIVEAGGQAVIAHPLKYGLTRSKLHELIKDFKEAGGAGIEVVSGDLNTTQINEMAGVCLRFNLLASSGSDFHGTAPTRVKLGGQQQLPVNCTPIWQQWNI